jgi:UDP-3-O-[3-hydroxymyristoyl] glucosamine N-acyltransferase
VRIGEESRLVARVTLCSGTLVGKRALLHPGSVIGREGFGFARDGDRWVRIPQVGRAILGDDVEIGANTTVDRGAIGDTLIGDGVKLDNHIQIGHNVEIGENTAMAANTGISGRPESVETAPSRAPSGWPVIWRSAIGFILRGWPW